MTEGAQEEIPRVTRDSREDCPRGSVSEQSMELSVSLSKNSLREHKGCARGFYIQRDTVHGPCCVGRGSDSDYCGKGIN